MRPYRVKNTVHIKRKPAAEPGNRGLPPAEVWRRFAYFCLFSGLGGFLSLILFLTIAFYRRAKGFPLNLAGQVKAMNGVISNGNFFFPVRRRLPTGLLFSISSFVIPRIHLHGAHPRRPKRKNNQVRG